MEKKSLSLIGMLLVTVMLGGGIFFYQGCGSEMAGNSASSEQLCRPAAGSEPIDKNYDVVPGQQTVSIAYGRPLLDSMVACTGIGQPSTRTMTEWTARNQSLSEYGSLTEVSGAMMMAIAAVAGEVCRDLLSKEAPLAASARWIFGGVDLNKTGSLTSLEVDSAADMMGLSCWQRLPTLEEKSMIQSSINNMGINTDLGAMALCTSMLASLSAIAQ